MAESKDHTNAELANVLDEHANDLIEGGKSDHGIEPFVRLAASRLRESDEPVPPVVALVTELRKIAGESGDADTVLAIRRMLGEYATR